MHYSESHQETSTSVIGTGPGAGGSHGLGSHSWRQTWWPSVTEWAGRCQDQSSREDLGRERGAAGHPHTHTHSWQDATCADRRLQAAAPGLQSKAEKGRFTAWRRHLGSRQARRHRLARAGLPAPVCLREWREAAAGWAGAHGPSAAEARSVPRPVCACVTASVPRPACDSLSGPACWEHASPAPTWSPRGKHREQPQRRAHQPRAADLWCAVCERFGRTSDSKGCRSEKETSVRNVRDLSKNLE